MEREERERGRNQIMPKAKKHHHSHHHGHQHLVLPDIDTPEFEAYHAKRSAELMATYDRKQAKRYKRLGITNPIAGMHNPIQVRDYYEKLGMKQGAEAAAAKAGKAAEVAPSVVLVPDAPAAAAAPSRAGRKRVTPTLIAPAAPAPPDELASVTTALIPEGHGKAPTVTSRHSKAGKDSVLKKRSRKQSGKSPLVRCGAILGECRNLVRSGRCHLHHGRRVME
jgi:hypothetical protein